MKIQTEVLIPGIENEQPLTVEVSDNVATFELGGKEIFRMDFEGNFDEFIIAIMKVWGGWGQEVVVQDKNKESEVKKNE